MNNRAYRTRTSRAAARGALLAAVILACTAGAHAQQGTSGTAAGESLELARETLKGHYRTQQLISQEEAEWKLGREILQSRIEFLKAQVEELKKRTAEGEESITEADKEREKLVAENEDLDAVEEIQYAAVEEFESRVRLLVPRLPEILEAKIKRHVELLPEAGKKRADIRLSISQRFANVLVVLKEVSRFAREITVVSERRRMDDGREAEVSTLYLGLAQAFYAGSGETADVAGIGLPGDGGWEWQARPDDAESIGRLIRIHALKEDAAFVAQPVRIK